LVNQINKSFSNKSVLEGKLINWFYSGLNKVVTEKFNWLKFQQI